MSISLVIRDGSPFWYLSPDIWVVPGSDPNGPAGSPVAGQSGYLWAHVANQGDTDANAVRVDFYWANPANQVLRSNATLVGTAFADLPAGGAQDVLCLVPWTPVMVNGGHECLVAVANHSGDPLPDPPPDDFNPPMYDQIAQKNLTVLAVGLDTIVQAITISGWRRADKTVTISAEVGGELEPRALESLGLRGMRPSKNQSVQVGLGLEPRCPGDDDSIGEKRLDLRVPRMRSKALFVSIRAEKHLAKDEYQLVHVVERQDDKVLGGLAFVLVPQAGGRKS